MNELLYALSELLSTEVKKIKNVSFWANDNDSLLIIMSNGEQYKLRIERIEKI